MNDHSLVRMIARLEAELAHLPPADEILPYYIHERFNRGVMTLRDIDVVMAWEEVMNYAVWENEQVRLVMLRCFHAPRAVEDPRQCDTAKLAAVILVHGWDDDFSAPYLRELQERADPASWDHQRRYGAQLYLRLLETMPEAMHKWVTTGDPPTGQQTAPRTASSGGDDERATPDNTGHLSPS